MKSKNIPVSDFYKLISFTSSGSISTTDLAEWLQLKTDKKFTVIEKAFLKEAIDNIKTTQRSYVKFRKHWEFYLKNFHDF